MVFTYFDNNCTLFLHRFQDLHLASQASSQLLTELKFKTEEKLTNNAVLCMKAALSLVLYTTQQLSVSQSDDSFVECKPCKSIVKRDIFVSLQQTLSEWISAVLGSGDIKVKKPRTEIDVNIFFFVITSSYPIQCAYWHYF